MTTDTADEPEILWYAPICEPCRRGEGKECHTPGCAFIWMRTPAEWEIDTMTLQSAADIHAMHRARWEAEEAAP